MRPYFDISHNGRKYYGRHMIATFEGCDENLLDIPTVKTFMIDLADAIKMVRYGDPIVARFGDGDKVGLSGVQLITTSAIVLHTNDAYRDMFLDVFSCRDFDAPTVLDMVKARFAPSAISHDTLWR